LGGRTTFGQRIVGERGINAGVHVRIDQAGECQAPLTVDDAFGAFGLNLWASADDLAIIDRDISAFERCRVRPHDPHVLDQQIVF
jgi:hypothetical protein